MAKDGTRVYKKGIFLFFIFSLFYLVVVVVVLPRVKGQSKFMMQTLPTMTNNDTIHLGGGYPTSIHPS